MQTLRLTQTTLGRNHYQTEISLEGDGVTHQTAKSTFHFKITKDDQERIRWYFEDYLQYPLDPNPKIAKRIESRMAEIGIMLFKSIFQPDGDEHDLCATLRSDLNNTRIEIASGVQEAVSIPWELLLDPKNNTILALHALSFVRSYAPTVERSQLNGVNSGPIRILLVICRPAGKDDVPFRSVASRLIKGLGGNRRNLFQLDVLRPPTFEQLGKVLSQADSDNKPYHLVHFDGHGMYEEIPTIRKGRHGYLIFEDHDLVDGPTLGKLLMSTNVRVLILNACRSAHAEIQGNEEPIVEVNKRDLGDYNNLVYAYGSFAHEVMAAGVNGVVAMRYNVYVETAAQFVADLYASLCMGSSLGNAVSLGRKQLKKESLRTIAYTPISLHDWSVPVVYETTPISLFSKEIDKLDISLKNNNADSVFKNFSQNFPKRPDVGFFGRDETLLAIDRALDTGSIVLLHAYAGSGKTATAVEFSRWYALTGGIHGPVLFTSFEQAKPLKIVLTQIESCFNKTMEQTGIHWLALDDKKRRSVALQLLQQFPILWVWDNVESVSGFSERTENNLSISEQQELYDFLDATRYTKAKFLLTSRSNEADWLGNLVKQIVVPPMPMQERLQLAKTLVEKFGGILDDFEDWWPLLNYTQGNPLTITVLVGQVVQEGLKTKEEIENFIDNLRSGEARFDDEQSEGRAKSLGASLWRGFEHVFQKEELKTIALLRLFQEIIDVNTLCYMGDTENKSSLSELHGLTMEKCSNILDRAAAVGLLTALNDGCYSIHPILPWYFKRLFDQYYPLSTSTNPQSFNERSASMAYINAFAEKSSWFARLFDDGNSYAIRVLQADEANLLYAQKISIRQAKWDCVLKITDGLLILYKHSGRMGDCEQLLKGIITDFDDQESNLPANEKEDLRHEINYYRVKLAEQAMHWEEAERLQNEQVEWKLKNVYPILQKSVNSLSDSDKNLIRNTSVSLHTLGQIRRKLNKKECLLHYELSYTLANKINEKSLASTCAFNLGNAYSSISLIKNLDQAEGWYLRSLDLLNKEDKVLRSKCFGELGTVYRDRALEAAGKPEQKENCFQNIEKAMNCYQTGLSLIPVEDVSTLAKCHNQIANLHLYMHSYEDASDYYIKAIKYHEKAEDIYSAAQTRLNMSIALFHRCRFEEAMDYAQSALRGYKSITNSHISETGIKKAEKFITVISGNLNK